MKRLTPSKRHHLILDVIDLDKNYLDSKKFLLNIIKDITELIKMKILFGPVIIKGSKGNPGLSAFCIIDYSHISIHTFTKKNEFYFDIFSCKPFNSHLVKSYIMKKLKVKENKIFILRPKHEIS